MATNLAEIRKQHSFTQVQLSRVIGKSDGYIIDLYLKLTQDYHCSTEVYRIENPT